MSKFIVVNIGCIECGVKTEIVGTYSTKERADQVALDQPDWRNGGQSSAEVFKVPKVDLEASVIDVEKSNG